MDSAGRKRKIETRGAEAAEEEQRKKLQAKLGKVHCNYCMRDVTDQMYIKSGVRPFPHNPCIYPDSPTTRRLARLLACLLATTAAN
jgi:hypothetical protein